MASPAAPGTGAPVGADPLEPHVPASDPAPLVGQRGVDGGGERDGIDVDAVGPTPSASVATGAFTPTSDAAGLSAAAVLEAPTGPDARRFSERSPAPGRRAMRSSAVACAVKLGGRSVGLIGVALPQCVVRAGRTSSGDVAGVPDPAHGELDMAKVVRPRRASRALPPSKRR